MQQHGQADYTERLIALNCSVRVGFYCLVNALGQIIQSGETDNP